MANILTDILVPKKRPNPKGTAYTSTFNPSQTQTALSLPNFQMHLQDIFDNRISQNSKDLLKDLFRQDPDVSATVNAYLTVANTEPRFWAYNMQGQLDPSGQDMIEQLLQSMFIRNDYTTGFGMKMSLKEHCEAFRYTILLTGSIAAEQIFDKTLVPVDIRHVNPNELEWYEKTPGDYKPQQTPTAAGGTKINLDIANFFVKTFRQNPFEIYSQSTFVSAINTIAARQQVVNDLYRIMQRIGYPRIEVKVMEEILRKNAPTEMQQNEEKMRAWLNSRLQEVATGIQNLGPDSAYVHTDAVEPKVMNEGGPGKSMDVTAIISVLNAQNQAALKTMASIIGRGESGVNTATVEARVFSLNAQEINGPIAAMLSDMFTLAMRMQGFQGYCVCEFEEVEMRASTELEPQLTMRQSRLLENLSLGLISDDEYHYAMFYRPAPPGAPKLSGTGFMSKTAGVDASSVSPNSDPLGRSITPEGSSSAKSNTVKKTTK